MHVRKRLEQQGEGERNHLFYAFFGAAAAAMTGEAEEITSVFL